jgi:hypothetical protein
MHAFFSFIVQATRNIRPIVSVHIEGKAKGEIWGVVPIKGSVNFFSQGSASSQIQ